MRLPPSLSLSIVAIRKMTFAITTFFLHLRFQFSTFDVVMFKRYGGGRWYLLTTFMLFSRLDAMHRH